MEITIHNVHAIDPKNDHPTLQAVGGLELPANDETIEAAMESDKITLRPYTAASFGYSFRFEILNGKIAGASSVDELNRFAKYLASLSSEQKTRLERFAGRHAHLTPAECMTDTFLSTNLGSREFAVTLMPELFHSAPPVGYLCLPAADEEFIDAIDRAHAGGCEFLVEVREMKRPYLKNSVSDYSNLYELNQLAQRLQTMAGADELLFEALVKMEKSTPNVARLINLSHNLACCALAPARNFDELGHFALENNFYPEYDTIPEAFLDTLDYEKIGRRFHDEQGGVFLDRCYVVNLASESEMLELYTGNPKKAKTFAGECDAAAHCAVANGWKAYLFATFCYGAKY